MVLVERVAYTASVAQLLTSCAMEATRSGGSYQQLGPSVMRLSVSNELSPVTFKA
jgi:hypothetical protein